MTSNTKRLLTRQETIINYKSAAKSYTSTPSQTFGLIRETTFPKLTVPPKSMHLVTPYNLYAACDEKAFYLFDKAGKLKNSGNFLEAFKTTSCLTFTYIEQYHCFAVISSDLKVLLVSVLLDLWKTIHLSGRVNHIEFYNNHLFLAGTSKITVINLQCDSKYDIEKSLLLDPDRGFVNFNADVVKELTFNIKWIKGLKVVKNAEVLLVWSECTIALVNLSNCKIRAEGEDLCPGTLITDVLYSAPQDYIIAATTQGSIFIYKVAGQFKQVHIFLNHTRVVSSLILINPQYFLSASMDYSVKLWSIEHFRLLYNFEMPITGVPISYLNLLDQSTLVYTLPTHLEVSHLNLIGKVAFITVSIVKSLKLIDEKIAVIGEDNSIVLYEHGKVLTTIYPPPSAHDLKDLIFIEKFRRVLVLLDSGVICLFSIEKETGLLERIIRTGDISDFEDRPLVNPIQCVKLINCIPPQYDCELVFKKISAFEPNNSGFLAMAAGKGTIMFMSIDKIDKIHARFSIQRESIIRIEEVSQYIITHCAANVMLISKFKENLLVVNKKIELTAHVLFLQGLEPDKLFISFNTGQTEIIQLSSGGILKLVNKESESDVLITSVCNVKEDRVLGIASNDNVVQVFNYDKQLLHQIKFPHPIGSLLIINENVIVSYKQTTTSVKMHKFFEPSATEYEEINEEYFKTVYIHESSESERSKSPLLRENTPERVSLYSRLIDFNQKTRSETKARKKKPTQKKSKKKKHDLVKKAVNNKLKELEELEREFYKKVISKKIPVIGSNRPVSNNVLLTRRQLTEEKIIENIRRWGDPADRIDYTGLCVVDESLYYEELAKLRGSNSII